MANRTFPEILRIGWVVITALMVLTAIEFAAAMAFEGILLIGALSLVALIKAQLIVNYFMHFHQLWNHIADVWRGVRFTREEEE